MIGFQYSRAIDVADAVRQMAASPAAKFIAGGTNLVDLMKMDVERPAKLIDVSKLPLDKAEETAAGGLRIGALVPNSNLAYHPLVERRYPVLSSALLAGASQQLRNMATVGGNLLQRTRCAYFYDIATSCNKRAPGTGCGAIGGHNRMNAILGTSDVCIAVHPSDMCVALAVLEAKVHVTSPRGERTIAVLDFHRLPGDTPQRDANLEPDELITAVELPPSPPGFATNHTYLKIRDRLSYAFALVSVAVGLELDGSNIKEARFALGGVAHKPWRNAQAEAALRGQPAIEATFAQAADLVVRDAKGFGHNAFKIDLTRRTIIRALSQAARGTPQSQSNKKIA
jgi:xanthine dehydrogenase YagS FAD-binding subunit